MSLSAWAAATKREIFSCLEAGLDPAIGEFDAGLLAEARSNGLPQMGSTTYSPSAARFEFVYAGAEPTAHIVSVTVSSPERIVYLPVPSWVVESIWQGHVDGSHHFESDARALLAQFEALTQPGENDRLFGPKPAVRRE